MNWGNKKFVLSLILIFFVLIIIISLIIQFRQFNIADYNYQGFPLKYYESFGPVIKGENESNFSLTSLIADLLFWFVVSLIIIIFVFKMRRRDK